jgi:3-oxoacyl-[acyl-carrier protein] reductase
MNLSLEGRYAVVCGSSQGIGLAIAEELALMGAQCILLARNAAQLELALSHLDTSLRQNHQYFAIDLSDLEGVRKLITQITSLHPVHILVNNSGGPKAGPIVDAVEDQFVQAFQQHVLVDHILTRAVLPGMRSESFGRIINVISTSVKTPLPNLGVSNTIRAAVASWAKTLSNEVAAFGITVNNVLPGYTRTQRLQSLTKATAERKSISESEVEQNMLAEVPARRFGEAAEIAAMAAFLASPAASYVNGTSIPVDGGKTDAF